MTRAQKILELFGNIGGGELRLKRDSRMLQCQSCGHKRTFPSGVYGTDGLGNSTRAPLSGAQVEGLYEKCEKCGKPMSEVHFSSARVMGGGMVNQGYAAPGGALSGGAYS